MTSEVSSFKDVATRWFWTAVAAAGGSLGGAVLFDVKPWRAAGIAGLGALISAITLFARQQLPTP